MDTFYLILILLFLFLDPDNLYNNLSLVRKIYNSNQGVMIRIFFRNYCTEQASWSWLSQECKIYNYWKLKYNTHF